MLIRRCILSIAFVLSLNSCTIIMDSSINTPTEPTAKKPLPASKDLNRQITTLIERIRELEEQRQDVVEDTTSTPVCGKFELPRIPPSPPMPEIANSASDDEFSQALVEYVVKLGEHSDRVIARIRTAYDRYSEACNVDN
ncbi:MAG: hypothetical protein CL582_04430 [Alteromonadaceae bacterium]|nr:hypothetical protein [Alteromonadaceae bacterium]